MTKQHVVLREGQLTTKESLIKMLMKIIKTFKVMHA